MHAENIVIRFATLALALALPAAAPAAEDPVAFHQVFLTPDTALARTVSRVAASGTTLLIGSTDAPDFGGPKGAVYAVDRQADCTWVQSGKILPPPGYLGKEFGAGGGAQAAFALPAGVSPALAGITVWHAFLVLDASGTTETRVSNPLPVLLVP